MLTVAVMVISGMYAAPAVIPDTPQPSLDDTPRSSGILATTVISFSANPTRAFVDEEITFTAVASSTIPGATLYFTIYFDSRLPGSINNTASPSYSTTSTDSPATISTQYAYDHIGNLTSSQGTYFVAMLWVSDGSETKTQPLIVYVVENSAPVFLVSLPPSTQYTIADEEFDGRVLTLGFSVLWIRVRDIDNDALHILWDFGDGNTTTNDTLPAGNGVYVNQSHVWVLEVPPGEGDYDIEYFVNLTVSDGNGHTITDSMRLIVSVPDNESPTIRLYSATHAEPNSDVTFTANATDPEGDPLTWTFFFGDGSSAVFRTDQTPANELVWLNVTHAFSSAGTYVVNMYVSDALVPNQVFPHNVSTSVTITIVENTLPSAATINAFPDTPQVNLTTGVAAVRFSVQVSDLDGDPLTVTWNFGDDTDEMLNVTSGGTAAVRLRQIHNYSDAGSFNVTVTISDGIGPSIVVWRILNVTSLNRPPSLIDFSFEYDGDDLLPNQTFQTIIKLYEPENDTLEISVDFGDGSPRVYLNLSDFDETNNVTIILNHSYSTTGTYTVSLRFTDNKIGVLQDSHTKISNRTIKVNYPEEYRSSIWDWWDFASLAMFCMIPGTGAILYLMARRRTRLLERKGISYEEWLTRKDELVKQLKEPEEE